MGTPRLGFGSALGIGVEATYGTPVARSNWVRMVSCDLIRRTVQTTRPHLGINGMGSANRRDLVDVRTEVRGKVVIEACYDDSTVLLCALALGAAATDAGTGPYTHTMENGLALPVGLTLEFVRGNATNSEVFEGCQISNFAMRGNVGEPVFCEFDFIGETSAARGAAGSPAGLDGLPILHHQAGQLGFNAGNYDIKSFRLELNRNLTTRYLYGYLTTAAPVRQGFEEIRLQITREDDADTLYAAHLAKTASDVTLSFTGTGNNALAITGHNAEITEYNAPISAPGPVDESMTLTCLSDGTDEGVALVYTNDNATYLIN